LLPPPPPFGGRGTPAPPPGRTVGAATGGSGSGSGSAGAAVTVGAAAAVAASPAAAVAAAAAATSPAAVVPLPRTVTVEARRQLKQLAAPDPRGGRREGAPYLSTLTAAPYRRHRAGLEGGGGWHDAFGDRATVAGLPLLAPAGSTNWAPAVVTAPPVPTDPRLRPSAEGVPSFGQFHCV